MTPLRIRVPLGADETPASFASRLAGANRLPAREFCLDFGTTLQKVVDGDREALSIIAGKGGNPVADLAAHAFVRQAGHGFEHRGERFVRAALRRSRICVCVACVRDDISANSRIEPWLAVHNRSSWMIDAVRTCPIHKQQLVEVASDPAHNGLHDFAAGVRSAVSNLETLAERAYYREPSALETYVLARLDKARNEPFLGSLELHAVIGMCEVVGAVDLFGRRVSLRRLDDQAWWRAGARGFEIVAKGEPGIREFLDRLRAGAPDKNEGPQAAYGRTFYDWIARGSPDPAFDPLRDIVRRHILDTTPLAAGELVFGQLVERRCWHSVRTLSQESGLHPKRLRKLLRAAGVISERQAGLWDLNVIFDAEAGSRVVSEANETLTLKAVESYAKIPRANVLVLIENGFIRPMAGTAPGLPDRYSRPEIDAFLGQLLHGAKPVAKAPTGAANIPSAAKRACCSAAEILRLILDRKLARVWRLAGSHGYMSVLVDVAEIRPFVRREDHGGISLRQLERELKSSTRVVRALIDNGHLRSRTAVNPINRCPQEVVDPADLKAFQDTYVSLTVLAAERGQHFLVVLKALEAAGVEPAFDPENTWARFYRRDSIQERPLEVERQSDRSCTASGFELAKPMDKDETKGRANGRV